MIRHVLAALLAWALLGLGLAMAQTQPVPPEHYTLDARGVDLVRGQFTYVAEEVAIGPRGQGGIVYGRIFTGSGWRDIWSGSISVSGSVYTVSLGGISEIFIKSGSTYTPVSNTGSTLVESPANSWLYRSADGVEAFFGSFASSPDNPYAGSQGRLLLSIKQPNGERLSFNYLQVEYCRDRQPIDPPFPPCTWWGHAVRLQSISNNRGYQVSFTYASDDPQPILMNFFRRTSAVGINLAVDYCAPLATSCTGLTQTWPSVTYSGTGSSQTVTDQSGRATVYTAATSFGPLTGIRFPGSVSNDIAISYASNRVASVTMAGSTWAYAYNDVSTTRTTTITNPDASEIEAVSDQSIGRLTSYENELGQTTSYQYDGQLRLERITLPEGNYTEYDYDGRGNVVTVTQVAKPSSGLADIVTSAAYPSTCTNPIVCNRPTSITDARGAVTESQLGRHAWRHPHHHRALAGRRRSAPANALQL